MNRLETALPGVLTFEPRVFRDSRGYFYESYSERRMLELGLDTRFVQDNHAYSQQGSLRGLHYQLRNPQAKLCRVVRGAVLDVAVDIRRGSPHFGQWVSVELSAENQRQIFVPRGFAHGYVVLTEEAEFLYKCDNFYTPGDEYGVAWDSPEISIDWGVDREGFMPLLSEKDAILPQLSAIPEELLPQYSTN